jgi:hypothetical protein
MPAGVFAQRCGAYLALAALALQLVLSFAHVHKHDFAFSRAAPVAVASTTHVRSLRQAAGRHRLRLATDDEHCTICFASFLLANSSIPDAPAKPQLPEWGSLDRSPGFVSAIVFKPRRAAFSSRAPPAC